jgi:hypothetical protein
VRNNPRPLCPAESLRTRGWEDDPLFQVLPYAAQSKCGLLGAFMITEWPDVRSIVWAESSLGGTVTGDPEIVKSVTDRYDALRAEAHPQHVSLRILKEVIERWI